MPGSYYFSDFTDDVAGAHNGVRWEIRPFLIHGSKYFRREEADMMEPKIGMKFLCTREKVVEFTLHDPNAMGVYLAGEFNSWEAKSLPMEKIHGRRLGGGG